MRTTARLGIVTLMALLALTIGVSVSPGETVATYELTFTKLWWPDSHPTDYPTNAHFSGLAGATHTSDVSFWNPGEFATLGIKDIAERGNKTAFSTEVNSALAAGTADSYLSYFGISGSRVSRTETFQIRESFPLATIVSMVAPSPDWFVGISSFDTRTGGEWVSSAHFDLPVWDAGTDDGITFEAPNLPAPVRQPIHLLDTFPFEGTGPVATFDLRLVEVAELVVLPGDFDLDGDVDGRDFLLWQRGGSPNAFSATDLAAWQNNHGSPPPLAASLTVPEPNTAILLLVGMMVVKSCHRCRSA
ncbi:MAG: spondin domain-containing protein [Bythopirellula sp.]|nr:spondin domain-containing protein [Bythopirellula sp.]